MADTIESLREENEKLKKRLENIESYLLGFCSLVCVGPVERGGYQEPEHSIFAPEYGFEQLTEET